MKTAWSFFEKVENLELLRWTETNFFGFDVELVKNRSNET